MFDRLTSIAKAHIGNYSREMQQSNTCPLKNSGISIVVTAAQIPKTDSSFTPALVRTAWGQFQIKFN